MDFRFLFSIRGSFYCFPSFFPFHLRCKLEGPLALASLLGSRQRGGLQEELGPAVFPLEDARPLLTPPPLGGCRPTSARFPLLSPQAQGIAGAGAQVGTLYVMCNITGSQRSI